MIAYLAGNLIDKADQAVIVETAGVGYEVFVSPSSLARFPPQGSPVKLHISESTAMYGGGTTLYGFLTREEKDIFLSLRENVPNTGAKKAIEYLDKAAKSLPDFRRAVMEGDVHMLAGVFGFTKKTSQKLIAALKDKLSRVPGEERFRILDHAVPGGTPWSQVLQALSAMGYRSSEARSAISAVQEEMGEREAGLEEIVRLALKKL